MSKVEKCGWSPCGFNHNLKCIQKNPEVMKKCIEKMIEWRRDIYLEVS